MLLYLLMKVLYGQLYLNKMHGYKNLHRYMNLGHKSVWSQMIRKLDFRKSHYDKISVKDIFVNDNKYELTILTKAKMTLKKTNFLT